jgi:hypothetical protein
LAGVDVERKIIECRLALFRTSSFFSVAMV